MYLSKSHNWNLEGLVYKQLHGQELCLNSRAIRPIQARMISRVALDYTVISRFALTTGQVICDMYHPVVSFDLIQQTAIWNYWCTRIFILARLEGVLWHFGVTGRDCTEHDKWLHNVMNWIQQTEVTLNKEKCEFWQNGFTFLGHVVSKLGISPDPTKLKDQRKCRDTSFRIANQLGSCHI